MVPTATAQAKRPSQSNPSVLPVDRWRIVVGTPHPGAHHKTPPIHTQVGGRAHDHQRAEEADQQRVMKVRDVEIVAHARPGMRQVQHRQDEGRPRGKVAVVGARERAAHARRKTDAKGPVRRVG